jgi:hypothetical protein
MGSIPSTAKKKGRLQLGTVTMPVIPVTGEPETGKIMVQGQSREKLGRPNLNKPVVVVSPVIPATWEALVAGSQFTGSQRLALGKKGDPTWKRIWE